MRSVLISGVMIAWAIGCGGMSERISEENGVDVGGRGGTIAVTGGTGNQGGTGITVGGAGGAGNQGGTGKGGTGGQGGTLIIVAGGTAGTGGASMGGSSTGAVGAAGPGEIPTEPPGPELCGDVECAAPSACCRTTARCFDPESEPELCPRPDPFPDPEDDRTPCASNAHCAGGEYCHADVGRHCLSPGYCQSRSGCGSSAYPVCACDGNSYADTGSACRAGTYAGVFYGGACGETIDANDGVSDPRWVTLCGSDAHCASDERCCRLTSICYPVSDPGRCQLPPDGTRYPCTADDQCYPGTQYCAGDGCEGPGGCTTLDPTEECGIRLEPVCGCDGVTYTSAPCASAVGVRIASEGECDASE